jgi:hypothetical protein
MSFLLFVGFLWLLFEDYEREDVSCQGEW